MTEIVVSIIFVAAIAMLVTRPGVADTIMRLSTFMMAGIQAALGADYE